MEIILQKHDQELATSFLESFNGFNYTDIKEQLNSSLTTEHDIDIIKYHILKKTSLNGNLEFFKNVLNDTEFKETIECEFDNTFKFICKEGHVELIKALISFAKENKIQKKIIDRKLVNRGFVWACGGTNVEMVDFLLNSKDLPFNAEITTSAHKGIEDACTVGNKKIVRYLLSSPKLSKHEDEILAFKHCHECDLHEMRNYLLFDYKITITPKLERYMNRDMELRLLLEKIRTKEKLSSELNLDTNTNISKKLKI